MRIQYLLVLCMVISTAYANSSASVSASVFVPSASTTSTSTSSSTSIASGQSVASYTPFVTTIDYTNDPIPNDPGASILAMTAAITGGVFVAGYGAYRLGWHIVKRIRED